MAFSRTILRFLPRPLRRMLRRWNSIRQVRAYTAERWPETELVRRFVRPGDVVIDAGANIGYITCILAGLVGPSGRVHSVEPVPETFDILTASVRAMGLHQVRCHACGVSDHPGEARMEVPSYDNGMENFYESRVVLDGAGKGTAHRSVPVRLATLDDLAGEDAGRIRFIKIDVEGHEEPALRGATRILEQSRPVLLIEIDASLDTPDAATARLLERLSALGYSPYVHGSDGLAPRAKGCGAVDYYFLTAAHADEIRVSASTGSSRKGVITPPVPSVGGPAC